MTLNRDLILIVSGRLVVACLALVSVRVITTFLSPAQYGEFALLITVQAFCGLFLVNPIGQHINLNTHAWWDEGTLLIRLKSYHSYVLVAAFTGGLVMFFMDKQYLFENGILNAVVMFSMVLAATWNATFIPILNMLGFRGAFVFWSIVTAMVSLVSSIALVAWLPYAIAWFAGGVIGMGVGGLGARYSIRNRATKARYLRDSYPLITKNTLLTYCLPLAVATGLMWVQMNGYRFLVENYWGLSQLGFLAVGFHLASQMWSIIESFSMQFFYPMFYRQISEFENDLKVEQAFSDLLNTLIPVYLILIGGIIISTPYLIRLLVAPQYEESLIFVVIGAAIEACRVLSNLLSNAAHAKRQTKKLSLPYAVGSIVMISLLYVAAVWELEFFWAGLALLAGAFVLLIVMSVIMYQKVRFTLDYMRITFGVVIIAVMMCVSQWLPKAPSVAMSLGMLSLGAIFAGLSVMAMLWKNPATLRLLSAQLRSF